MTRSQTVLGWEVPWSLILDSLDSKNMTNKTKKVKRSHIGTFCPLYPQSRREKTNTSGLSLKPSNATINYYLSKNNKILFGEKWKELEITVLYKVSHTQENNRLHFLSFTASGVNILNGKGAGRKEGSQEEERVRRMDTIKAPHIDASYTLKKTTLTSYNMH